MNVPLSHDPPCPLCHHSNHWLVCEDHGVCDCAHSPMVGVDR